MADTKTSPKKAVDQLGTRENARAISDADDGGQSRLTKGYKDNPDKPDESSIAQIEELVEA